ncbi:MAG: hypothetical protein KGI67_12505 [Pseudomonadota bacterium]|nr:hypothetical protein [Pseudomonadota bacterium]
MLPVAFVLGMTAASPAVQAALTDEIQVYDDSINKPGEFGLELHVNATPAGHGQPAYAGEFTTAHGLRTTLEASYALDTHYELGLYLPFDRLGDGSERFAGPRVRVKWIGQQAAAATPWFYGLNFELGSVHPQFEQQQTTLEARPIMGWRQDGWAVVFNPVVGIPLKPGYREGGPDFSPALKLGREVADGISAGFEYYADLGQFSHFDPYSQQAHTLFAALDVDRGPLAFNVGIGRGLTAAADRWTIKAIFEIPL